MTRIDQARPTRLSVILIGSAAMLLFAPTVAWAEHDRDDYDRHRYRTAAHYDYGWQSGHAYDRYDSHKRYKHAAHKRHKHHAHHKRHHKRGKRLGHLKHAIGYYCEPCDRFFHARSGLYDHVAHRHRVPFRNLSFVIRFGPLGWIFFG